jgi:AcrR family transcriptional regulator
VTGWSAGAQDGEEAVRAVRTQLRRRQLLDAAARLMDRRGFHSVSMQALADEAGVSVGLIYKYFSNKEDLLLAVIVNVLDAFAAQVPPAIEAAGDDPVERIVAGFRAYCTVIAEHRHAAVLTYRESNTLGESGRAEIKKLELNTAQPLREAIRDAMVAGALVDADADLVAYDMLLMAHAWALKHWWFEQTLDFEGYLHKQAALILRGLVQPRRRRRYQHLL